MIHGTGTQAKIYCTRTIQILGGAKNVCTAQTVTRTQADIYGVRNAVKVTAETLGRILVDRSHGFTA
jgi:hypothetical protein